MRITRKYKRHTEPRISASARRLVHKRDKRKCQNLFCLHRWVSPPKYSLDIHHILDYSSNLKLKDNPDNLISLCSTYTFLGFKIKGCHDLFHAWMGGTKESTDGKNIYGWITLYGLKRLINILIFFIVFAGIVYYNNSQRM